MTTIGTGFAMNDRNELIKEQIKIEEEIEATQLTGIKQKIWEFLVKEKQFKPEEIMTDPKFKLTLGHRETLISIDFVINLPSASFMVIQCSSSSLEAWERYVTSFARVVKDYQIPYAVVTDGEKALIINVLGGRLIGESLSDLFTRGETLNRIKDFKKIPCPANRLEKEKRIVYAFESIKSPTIKDFKE
jgi:Type I restriction enzyme R protein N terminus (HSDR_N)